MPKDLKALAKGWAIVNPKGKLCFVSLSEDEVECVLWNKPKGYRPIRVLITPV